MTGDIEWIKLSTAIFNDDKMKVILSMPDGEALFNTWIRILCLAGRVNDHGLIYLAPGIPYTEETLATVFNKPLNHIKLALETFHKLKIVTSRDDGVICITNWMKYQNVKGLDDIREATRKRNIEYRKRQKTLQITDRDVTMTSRMTQCDTPEIERDKEDIEREEEKEKKKKRVAAKPPLPPSDYSKAMDIYQSLFIEVIGEKPLINGITGQVIKRLLASQGLEKFERVAKVYFTGKWYFTENKKTGMKTFDIRHLEAHWNEMLSTAMKGKVVDREDYDWAHIDRIQEEELLKTVDGRESWARTHNVSPLFLQATEELKRRASLSADT